MLEFDKIRMPVFEFLQRARVVQVLEKGPLCCHPSMVGVTLLTVLTMAPCGSFRRRNGLHL